MEKTNFCCLVALLLLLVGCATAPKKPVDLFAVNPHYPLVFPGKYTVHRVGEAEAAKLLHAPWDDELWESAETLDLANFREESSFYYVTIRGKLLHDGRSIYGIFHTPNDRFVYATHFADDTFTCMDNCVEVFFQPERSKWYVNCEFSLTGAVLTQFHPDMQNPLMGEHFLAPEDRAKIQVYNMWARLISPEVPGPVEWTLAFKIPMEAIEPYGGPIGELSGQTFLANFYHCADLSSHPRWVSWAPVPILSFHLPECFREIVFE